MEAHVTWRAAITMALITTAAPVFAFLDFPWAGSAVLASRLLALGWGGGLVALLVSQRRHPRLVFSRIAFGLASVPLLALFWTSVQVRVVRELPLEMFLRVNLMSVVFAALTPPSVLVTLLVIAIFTVENLALFLVGPLPETTNRLEPWTSLFIGLFAVWLAWFRARRQRREVNAIVTQEQGRALERLAQSFLAVRDLANTPLQTLEVTISLLQERCPSAQALTRRMGRSLARLRELNEILVVKERTLEASEVDESFDGVAVLRSRQGHEEQP